MVYLLALYTQQRRPILHDLPFARLRRITIGSTLRVFDRRLYSITIIYDDNDDIVRDFHRCRLSNDASTYNIVTTALKIVTRALRIYWRNIYVLYNII